MATPGFCSRCGARLIPGSSFCNNCGISLNQSSTQTETLLTGAQSTSFFDQTEYIIDKKILAIRDTFAVKSRQGELLGYVKKKMVSIGPQFWFEDLNGQRLGEVHARILTIRHTYEIFDTNGEKIGVVNKKLMKLLGTEWWLEAPPGVEIARVQGNILNHDYMIQDQQKNPIAQVHKKWVSVRDSYGIEIFAQTFNRLLILGFVTAMDSILDKN